LLNNYCGFKAEYKVHDLIAYQNELLSVKTVRQERTILKKPLYHEFDISYVHPLSYEVSDIFKNKVDSENS
jgi:hypothetical protein